jgi:UDP-2-acetamido-2,6-beta-L-arabino-hexul-4-ose reductase
MRVLITGANGFIGKNLQLHLAELSDVHVVCFTRDTDLCQLHDLLQGVDFVFHLAGVNRPKDLSEFESANVDLTRALCQAVGTVATSTRKKISIVYTSSSQAGRGNAYGISKLAAENALFALQREHGVPVHVYRLPNVVGKWCKPNYNSAVATFCHNIARDLPIQVNDPAALVSLVFVDDVIASFMQLLEGAVAAKEINCFASVAPQYNTTVGELARLVQSFKDSRTTMMTERVGTGLTRALYSTYVSYLPPESFNYALPQYADPRGVFVEMLKTPDCGQFSYFTVFPGITRGGHYHHSKTEKFLVIKGKARFKFRHMQTGHVHELLTTGDKAEVVESVPGWTHDITNIGVEEMIVMLWANEVFDREKPDTIACAV